MKTEIPVYKIIQIRSLFFLCVCDDNRFNTPETSLLFCVCVCTMAGPPLEFDEVNKSKSAARCIPLSFPCTQQQSLSLDRSQLIAPFFFYLSSLRHLISPQSPPPPPLLPCHWYRSARVFCKAPSLGRGALGSPLFKWAPTGL